MADYTNPIVLESFGEEHEVFLKSMESIPSLWTFTHTLAKDLLAIQRLPTTRAFIIKESTSTTPIGFTQIKNIDFQLKRGESGTRLLPSFQGKGLNKYIKEALLTFSFDILQLEEVYCLVNTNHLYSQKSLLQIGFEPIPTLDTFLTVGSTQVTNRFNYFSMTKKRWVLLN